MTKTQKTKCFKDAVVLEGLVQMLTCTSRCQPSWKAALISSKRGEEQGAKKAWVTSATDTDLIGRQGLPCRAHPREGRLKVSLISFCSCVWAPLSFSWRDVNSPQTQACLCCGREVAGERFSVDFAIPSAYWCLHHLGILIIASIVEHKNPQNPSTVSEREIAYRNSPSPSLPFNGTIFTLFY